MEHDTATVSCNGHHSPEPEAHPSACSTVFNLSSIFSIQWRLPLTPSASDHAVRVFDVLPGRLDFVAACAVPQDRAVRVTATCFAGQYAGVPAAPFWLPHAPSLCLPHSCLWDYLFLGRFIYRPVEEHPPNTSRKQ